MPDAIRVCKVCGKVYPYCTSKRTAEGLFRWQDVACCKEHGIQYLNEVLEARNEENPYTGIAD